MRRKKPVEEHRIHVKTGDKVVVTSGKDKGKVSSVKKVITSQNKVLVEGINVRTRHVKPRRQGEESGIIKREAPVNISKVSYFCPKCERGTKLGIKIVDGKRIRFCRKCKEEIK
jgi:large subunit ribosomal protein L24